MVNFKIFGRKGKKTVKKAIHRVAPQIKEGLTEASKILKKTAKPITKQTGRRIERIKKERKAATKAYESERMKLIKQLAKQKARQSFGLNKKERIEKAKKKMEKLENLHKTFSGF